MLTDIITFEVLRGFVKEEAGKRLVEATAICDDVTKKFATACDADVEDTGALKKHAYALLDECAVSPVVQEVQALAACFFDTLKNVEYFKFVEAHVVTVFADGDNAGTVVLLSLEELARITESCVEAEMNIDYMPVRFRQSHSVQGLDTILRKV